MSQESENILPDDADLTHVLAAWEYEPGTITVRRIIGRDGKAKLQMRLELGVLQMEETGRPDGATPHGFESLLDYHEKRICDHRQKHGGTIQGFGLEPEECQHLREEAAMYYQRYLSFFALGDFSSVVRDTARNLRVLDLCGKYAIEEQDRIILEQYRPYIIMMRTRADASLHVRQQQYHQALDVIRSGLAEMRDFFERFNHPEAFDSCDEAKVLKRFAREVRKKLPVGQLERLQKKLKRAVVNEEYELAAKLRDQIAAMENTPQVRSDS
jgi:hypothetical protein